MLLRAVWQLPSSIKFDIVALSSDVEVELDGCLVTLTLPVWDAANKTVVPPPIDLPAQPMNGDYWMWGGYSWSTPAGTAAWVAAVVLTIDTGTCVGTPPAVAGRMIVAARRWFDLARPWIEAITGQDLNPLQPPPVDVPHRGFDWWTDINPDVPVLPETTTTIMGSPDPALTMPAWEHIVAEVEAGVAPPETWVLLRDARLALRRRDFRRAVVDASTVTEMCLWRALEEAHRRQPSLLADLLMTRAEKRATLGTLFDYSVGVAIPNIPADHSVLTGVRNDALHKTAVRPTGGQAARWVEVAELLVADVQPLGPDLEPLRFPRH